MVITLFCEGKQRADVQPIEDITYPRKTYNSVAFSEKENLTSFRQRLKYFVKA